MVATISYLQTGNTKLMRKIIIMVYKKVKDLNKWLNIFVISIVIPFSITGCSDKDKQSAVETPIRPVMFEQVTTYKESGSRAFSGVARSASEARMSFKVAGTITALPVKVGDSLSKGQLIAAIDARDFQLKVNEANAGLKTAQSRLRAAKSNYSRVLRLYEHRNASKSDLDSARTAFEEANAGVSATSQQLTLAKRQLSYAKIYSPAACKVAATLAQKNENIAAGQPLALLNCGNDIEVEIAVPEQFINSISQSSSAKVTFASVPNVDFNAIITEIGVASTGRLTTFPVTLGLDNNGQVLSGMAATVFVELSKEAELQQVFVSPNIVQEDQSGRFVYVLKPVNEQSNSATDELYMVEKRMVKTGQIDSRGLIVTSGLVENEKVVSAGIRHMRDGLIVKLYKK